jgi:4,5-DOPA dioxygenase extradiol
MLLRAAGLPAHVEATSGLDHGIWTPLRSMFPRADIPVLPLAWPPMWQPAELFRLGEALAPLAAEASGAITHNLRPMGCAGQTASPTWKPTRSGPRQADEASAL